MSCANVLYADDLSVDWISNKLYWTNNGQFDGIGVLDLSAGYHRYLINTGQDNSPKAIVVDPLTRFSDHNNITIRMVTT